MPYKEIVIECLLQDDEAFSQIMEYFKLPPSIDLSEEELQNILSQMIKDGYICVNYNWKTEKGEYPYSLTEKGKNSVRIGE